ncbi:50S ribosomal protein L11 methyltransferase [Paenalcaligenes niemegkensis]|uniref:50S ribosomal protein L11 methyltransferase n=1 Tax=Paenalcaligenes niemegkensis TaxID=2895469 RepID=UPI001EE95D5B|nr:50S ribosomal protein L11 methyltransferase [Paenalcaligenes niemegkensis]MCQ9615458.1 50S ribosomal protein L11 methyltransferase [Paenalcaligenes niemegkensis]
MRELVLHCDEQQAESLSDALLELGVLSVSVEDADEHTENEQPLFGEPGLEPDVFAWRRNRVVALLPDDSIPEVMIRQLREWDIADISDGHWEIRDVPDNDWVRLTQAQFGPMKVGERVLIVPSWHRDDPELPSVADTENTASGLVRIELDPGLAFGTGSHPTTHLCLKWLSSHLPNNSHVLDYGCGSGILAIAAKKLGAQSVRAVDIDEQAVLATQYNAGMNRAVLNATLPDELEDGTYDVVVANILSGPLKVMASMLCNRVAPNGWLVLSGILEWQTQEMIDAYAPWLTLKAWDEREGWVCLAGQRPE